MSKTPRRHQAFLREHREALGLNGPQMAARMNAVLDTHTWDKSVVARYERAERGLSPDLEDAYAKVFGCSIAELYEPPAAGERPNIHKMLRDANADESLWQLVAALAATAIQRHGGDGAK